MLLLPCGLSAQVRPRSVETTRLAEGVYLFRTPFDGWVDANSVAIITSDEVVVFDSHTLREDARAVIAEIRKLTPKPVRLLVNSHWHIDHWSGNEVYAEEFPGIQIIATAETREFMANTGPLWANLMADRLAKTRATWATTLQSGRLADGTVITDSIRRAREEAMATRAGFVAELAAMKRRLPDVTYTDSLTLTRGGRTMHLYSMTGDATASTVLYLPDANLVVLGDLLVHPVTWTTNSYQITPWAASLRRVRALNPAIVVPGMGPAFNDTRYLDLVLEFFDATAQQVRQLVRSGEMWGDSLTTKIDVARFRSRFANGDAELEADFDGMLPGLVTRLARELRDGIDPKP
jgi:glyoxylase-like metal-dependent hydrolase (beta-lactamase superfamily II)